MRVVSAPTLRGWPWLLNLCVDLARALLNYCKEVALGEADAKGARNRPLDRFSTTFARFEQREEITPRKRVSSGRTAGWLFRRC